jgi:hypothetical protein
MHDGRHGLGDLGLAALVALIHPPQVTPDDANAIGRMHLLSEDQPDWGADELKQRLRSLRFRTVADTWEPAARLLAGGGKGIDNEVMNDGRDPVLRMPGDIAIRLTRTASSTSGWMNKVASLTGHPG